MLFRLQAVRACLLPRAEAGAAGAVYSSHRRRRAAERGEGEGSRLQRPPQPLSFRPPKPLPQLSAAYRSLSSYATMESLSSSEEEAVAAAEEADPRVYSSVSGFREARRKAKVAAGAAGRPATVGFVPTMGALHDAHLSLFRRARAECDVVVASIFVNPTQFGENEDFDDYPRQLRQDVAALDKEGLVDLVFAPQREEMYAPNQRISVNAGTFEDLPEGKARPGHFSGVATIVAKLLSIVRADKAYFGQKDAAQCVLIHRLVEDLNLHTQVVVCPTGREADGLAMSSRNAYLSAEERHRAPVVYASLLKGLEAFQGAVGSGATGVSSRSIVEAVRRHLDTEPLIKRVEYVSVGSPETMEEVREVQRDAEAVLSLAVKLGEVRLIDNIRIRAESPEEEEQGRR